MTFELSKNFHGVGIGPLSKILAVNIFSISIQNRHKIKLDKIWLSMNSRMWVWFPIATFCHMWLLRCDRMVFLITSGSTGLHLMIFSILLKALCSFWKLNVKRQCLSTIHIGCHLMFFLKKKSSEARVKWKVISHTPIQLINCYGMAFFKSEFRKFECR